MLDEFLFTNSYKMLFNQDGQLPHFHKELMDILNLFPYKWIASAEPIIWPRESP
jgi:hypothetical protein